MVTPEEQIWAVMKAITDNQEITPSGDKIYLDPRKLEKTVSRLELNQILTKLERDEKIIEIVSRPEEIALDHTSGCYGLIISDNARYREFLNRAHSLHSGNINRLEADNFFAVSEVAMDILQQLQIVSGERVTIPLIPSVVRFSSLCPAKSPNLLDRYADFRWKALMYMREREYIQDFAIKKGDYFHRWEQEITVGVDRYNYDRFYKRLGEVYERRVVEPQRKNAKKEGSPKVSEAPQVPPVQKIEITSMPELQVRNADDNTITKGKKRIHLPKFKSTDWTKITIRFIDERNVLINADKKEQVVADYETLGFADERRNKPNIGWAFLLGLAKNGGETATLEKPIPDSVKQQKKQLSDRLKTIFKNETDPFYDPSETNTYKVKINLIPPQEESTPDTLGTREFLLDTMTEVYDE